MTPTLVIDFNKSCWVAGFIIFDIDEFLESPFDFGSLKGYWSPECTINEEENKIASGQSLIPLEVMHELSSNFNTVEFDMQIITGLN